MMKRPAEDILPQQIVGHLVNGNGKINGNATSHMCTIHTVAILDCGAQYGKVIDRRVREMNIKSHMLPLNTQAQTLVDNNYGAIIISGGPKSVYALDAPAFDANIFHCGIPVLGICYGFQLMHKAFGGNVIKDAQRSDGQTKVSIDKSCQLFKGLSDKEAVLLTHGDRVQNVTNGFKQISLVDNIICGIANEERKLYGLQFHPEVDLTTNGKLMLKNFLFNIANLEANFSLESRLNMCDREIRNFVGDKQVMVLCSGGVDSTVCAMMLFRALPKTQVTALHVNNGLLRDNETEQVQEAFKKLTIPLHVLNVEEEFLYGTCLVEENGKSVESPMLCNIVDPELKRRIIGDTFVKVYNQYLTDNQFEQDDFILAQGTLRPDLIESASKTVSSHADTIKTHHNDTPMVREKRLKKQVIEPLSDFHKDEVRALGVELGLPDEMVNRHPFPGPGLAIRILCCETPLLGLDFKATQSMLNVITNFNQYCEDSAVEMHKSTDYLRRVQNALGESEAVDLRKMTSQLQLNALLLPIQSVGVQGDARSYSYVCALSMTQHAPIPWIQLFHISNIITKVLHNINRVVYILGPPVNPAITTIQDITPTLINPASVQTLRRADAIATHILNTNKEMAHIAQMPVVLLPIDFDRDDFDNSSPSVRWSICLRPFITQDFMTGTPAQPKVHINEKTVLEMGESIKSGVRFISRVVYDLTAKPPGTTEWE